MNQVYDIPHGLSELFEEECSYKIIDYDIGEMNNIESMKYFLDQVGIKEDMILLDDGTQVHLSHPNYNYHLVIDSSGLGDSFSHKFEITKIYFCDYKNEFEKEKNINIKIIKILSKKENDINSEDLRILFESLYINK